MLTHWGRDKMAAISQTTLSNAFSWMKMLEFRKIFHWSLFIRVQLIISQHWFRWWLGAYQATSHYLNQWWLDYRRIYASLGLNELSNFEAVALNVSIAYHWLCCSRYQYVGSNYHLRPDRPKIHTEISPLTRPAEFHLLCHIDDVFCIHVHTFVFLLLVMLNLA